MIEQSDAEKPRDAWSDPRFVQAHLLADLERTPMAELEAAAAILDRWRESDGLDNEVQS